MRILFLSQRVPYPPNRGDKITTWRLVERMRRRHEVWVCAFAHDAADLDAARQLSDLGIRTVAVRHDERGRKLRSVPLLLTKTPLTLGVYGSHHMQREVDALAPQCDLAYAYSSSMGAFLEPHAGLPRVMHFAELDSDKWRQYAEASRFPMRWVYAREQRTLLRFETRIARAFSENVFCTPLEQGIFQRAVPGAPSLVLRNGVDLTHFQPQRARAEADHLVFTGVMDYFPNRDAVIWFAREIFPRIRARRPQARFSIVGSKPAPDVLALARADGVTVTGFVPETRDWLARAALSVAPLRIARGIQNKVLEALAMGLPTVGTTCATQGVEGRAGQEYLVRDDAASFADAVLELLEDPRRAEELGMRARAFVERRYDWEVVFEPLDDLLDRLVGAAAGAPRRPAP